MFNLFIKDLIENFFIFSLGASVGSFINVIIWRLPNNLSILFPRSRCIKCKSLIRWQENIPILSWIFLKGKCKECNFNIPKSYLIIEIIVGSIFLFIRYNNQLIYEGLSPLQNCLISFILVTILIPLFVLDFKYLWLPSSIINFGILSGIIFVSFYSFSFGKYIYVEHICAGLVGFLSLSIISVLGEYIANKPILGFGDAKLAGLIGVWVGFKGLFLSLYLSFIISGLLCIVLLIQKKINRKSIIPFGPFMIISMIMIWFVGLETFNNLIFRGVFF